MYDRWELSRDGRTLRAIGGPEEKRYAHACSLDDAQAIAALAWELGGAPNGLTRQSLIELAATRKLTRLIEDSHAYKIDMVFELLESSGVMTRDPERRGRFLVRRVAPDWRRKRSAPAIERLVF